MLVNFNVACHNKDLPLLNLPAIFIIRYIYVFFKRKIQIFYFLWVFYRKNGKKEKSEIKFKIPLDKGSEVWYHYFVLY